MARSLSPVLPLAPDIGESLPRWRDRLYDEHRFRTEQIALLNREIAANPQLNHDGVTIALRSGAMVMLEDVTAALARMDAGDYGRCTRCVQPIPGERLDVLPMTALCMPCQYEEQSHGR